MRRKFRYLVDKTEMSKKDFENELKKYCNEVVRTDYMGCIGVDLLAFDEKKFKSCMREVEKGTVVLFLEYDKSFRREVVR